MGEEIYEDLHRLHLQLKREAERRADMERRIERLEAALAAVQEAGLLSESAGAATAQDVGVS